MNTESRLRAALKNTAELVEDRPRGLPVVRRRNRRPMFAPAWAAVAITAVVIASFVIRDQGELGDATTSSSPQAVGLGSSPKFYLAVYRATAGRAARFETLSTATGELLDVNKAGNHEDFIAAESVPKAAVVPKAGVKGAEYFYLLARVGAGASSSGCGDYAIRRLQFSSGGKFLSWGTTDLEFEARDNEPMQLATTKAGDEVAYSYRDCASGELQVAHRWNGTTTTWGSEKPVTSLAYTPDGQSLIIGRQTAYGKDGFQTKGELWTMKTRDPGFEPGQGQLLLATNKDIALLSNATISSDGTEVIAVFVRTGSFIPFSVAKFSLKTGKTSRFLGWFDQQATDLTQQSIDPDAPGKNVLIRSGNKIVIMGSGYPIVSRILTGPDQPIDVAW
jgi:hypothetical protein